MKDDVQYRQQTSTSCLQNYVEDIPNFYDACSSTFASNTSVNLMAQKMLNTVGEIDPWRRLV